jgi:hypothetical protein
MMAQKELISVILGLLMITLIAWNLPLSIFSYDCAVAYAMGPSVNMDKHHGDRDRDRDRDRRCVRVPEPSTLLLLGVGVAGVGLLKRKFKK